MRYTVKGAVIRTENAAKPIAQASVGLVKWLRQRTRTHSALDYGCGKLRYTGVLAERSSVLGLVDSEIQLSRVQRIDGQDTSVREYARAQWPDCQVHTVDQFLIGVREEYDFVLCANVLSAIPCEVTRARSLEAILSALSTEGELLVVNQHTNSYFKEVADEPNSQPYMDGWLRVSRRGLSYYGILGKVAVEALLRRVGFQVSQSWIEGQSNYVLAGRNRG